MKTISVFALCLFHGFCIAQKTIDVDKTTTVPANFFYMVGSEPVLNVKFVRLSSGTPFFTDEWLKAKGVSANGIVYHSGLVKLNLLESKVHFLNQAGQEMIATSPLEEIILEDTVQVKNFHFVHLPQTIDKTNQWFQQLSKGQASLYCEYNKLLHENRPYGAATVEQSISTKEVFYLLHNNVLTRVKKPKDILLLLGDKQSELTAYLKNNQADGMTMAKQLQSLVDYYNSLF